MFHERARINYGGNKMKLDLYDSSRTFQVEEGKVTITDHGKITLGSDEMVSFRTPSGRECDFTAKNWGFYLGPSINGRLKNEGFKVALVMSKQGKIYINAVEEDKVEEFKEYLRTNQNSRIVRWLDEWSNE